LLSLTESESHIEKDFKIIGVSSADTTSFITLAEPVVADVDGNFSFDVSYGESPEVTDTIVGRINFETGILDWQSIRGETDRLQFSAVASLEENRINPKVRYTIDKIRFQVMLRQISAEWTIPFEQDMKALYDINVQSELVNIIGEQIAAEIDREIIDALISGNSAFNDPALHTATFDKNPPANFYWGRKAWYENILPTLTKLSAQVYNSTLMGAANTLACNPLDAAIFENLNDFAYTGNSVDGGDVGYRSATVQGGKWKILVSSIVPDGKIVVKYRSNEMQRAAFVYAPYVPALLTPYPIGAIPSMTVMTRYASKLIRPEALAVLNIVDTAV
jgi:rRNA processing protein Krr1/Pno1